MLEKNIKIGSRWVQTTQPKRGIPVWVRRVFYFSVMDENKIKQACDI